MEFYIGKNSTLPVLKMQIVKDGRVDYESFNNLIEKSSIYFSMVDTKTGRVKINLAAAGFVNKIFDDPNTPPEYYIYYKFTKRDTNKIGKYEGQFLLKNEEGTLILPIREKLLINIVESNIPDTEQELNTLTLSATYHPGSIVAEYLVTLTYPIASEITISFQNFLYVINDDPIIINETITLPAKQISKIFSFTINGDYFSLTKTAEFKNVNFVIKNSTPFKYQTITSYVFDDNPLTPTPTETPSPTLTPSPSFTITQTITTSLTQTPTTSLTPTPSVTPTLSLSQEVTTTPTETLIPTVTPTPTETIITLIDPILVGQTNEFISVGDGFYLKYVDFEQIITDAILVNNEYLNVGDNFYLKFVDPVQNIYDSILVNNSYLEVGDNLYLKYIDPQISNSPTNTNTPTPTPTLTLTQTPTVTVTPTVTPSVLNYCPTGSLSFGVSGRYLSLEAGENWSAGTGDFCIEWWQYQTQSSPPSYSRVFQVGDWPNHSIAISIESGNFLVWVNNGSNFYANEPLTDYLNQWVHFVFLRQSGVVSVYKNGVRFINVSASNDVNDVTNELKIGEGSGNWWNGDITNFRWVNGNSVYDGTQSTITVPTEPLTNISGTKLLLLANDNSTYLLDSSSNNLTVTNNGSVTWSSNSPNFLCPNP